MFTEWISKLFAVDERFIMHRYYSTRWAVVVGGILMGGWVLYEYYVNRVVRYDFILIMLAMAVTKLGMMVYYRITQ